MRLTFGLTAFYTICIIYIYKLHVHFDIKSKIIELGSGGFNKIPEGDDLVVDNFFLHINTVKPLQFSNLQVQSIQVTFFFFYTVFYEVGFLFFFLWELCRYYIKM